MLQYCSRHAPEDDLGGTRMAVGTNSEEIRSAFRGMRQDDVCDRNSARGDLLDFDRHTMSCKVTRYIDSGLLAMSLATLARIYYEHGDEFCLGEKRQGVGYRAARLFARVPCDHNSFADRVCLPIVRHDEHGNAARKENMLRQPILRQSVRRVMANDDQIGVKGIQNNVSAGIIRPDNPELGRNIVFHDEIREAPAGIDCRVLLCHAVAPDHRLDGFLATRIGIGRIPVETLGHYIDADQMRCVAPGKLGRKAESPIALESRINEDHDVFQSHDGERSF